jgi:hypothetical protein
MEKPYYQFYQMLKSNINDANEIMKEILNSSSIWNTENDDNSDWEHTNDNLNNYIYSINNKIVVMKIYS